MKFTAVDFETANYSRNSACSIGVVRVENGRIVAKERRLINPQTYFLKDFIEDIHGITAEDIKDAPLFGELWSKITHFFYDVDFIAAHNAPFDRSVLQTCCNTYQIIPPAEPFVCTVQLARKCWKLNPADLETVCHHLQIPLNHHEALSDAEACARIVIKAIEYGHKIDY